jgi:hypothetical protein
MSIAESLMKAIIVLLILVALTLLFSSAASAQTAWDSSPYNWKNSPHNWDNSSHNWDNSPHKWNNERIILDNQGRATGYVVPKKDGGVNYCDFKGNRTGYKAGQN